MPIKKHANRKNNAHPELNKALIPTKEATLKRPLKISTTARELQEHRVTSFATARKKKRPK